MIGEFGAVPLVGRREVLAGIQASILGPGGGALVVAEPGTGKSAVARAAVAALGDRVHPMSIYAGPELAGVPFGALAPQLGPMTAAESGSVLAAMRSLLARMRSAGTDGKPVLMIIDDVQELDEGSAVLVAQLVSSGAAKLLALGTVRPPVSQELLSLAADRLLTRHDLGPLTQAETGQLCREVLGGQVLDSSSASLQAAAGGIPGFILALLAQARRSGTLVERNGVWMLTGEPGPPDARVIDLVKARLGNRSAAAREALETIALAEPLSLQVLLRSAAGAHLDDLAADGAITVDPDRLVRIAHPLHAEVIRKLVPANRNRRLRQQVLAAMDSGPDAYWSLLRSVDWSLDCGLQVPDGQLLRAARLANDAGDSALALKAATAVASVRLQPAAHVQAGRAYAAEGDYRKAAASGDEALDEAHDLVTAAGAALLGARAWASGTAPARLEDVAGRWAQAVERITAADSGCERLAEWSRTGIRLLRLGARVAAGDYSGTEAELGEIIDQPEDFAETALMARVLTGEVLIATGRAEAGILLTAQALAMLRLDGARLQPFRDIAVSTHVLGLIRLGSPDRIPEVLAEFPESAHPGRDRPGGAAGLAAAVAAMDGVAPDSGLALFKPAVEALEISDSQQLLPVALAAGAYLAALAGDEAAAGGYLARISVLGTWARPQLQLLGDGYAAAAGFLQGGGEDLLDALRNAADEASRRGWISDEIELRTALLQVGDLGVLDQLAKATENAEGPLAAALNSMARAVMVADVESLEALADHAHGPAVLAIALAALRRAETVAGPASADTVLARKVLPALEKFGFRQQADHRPAADGTPGAGKPAAVKLTGRERAIAELVAQGLKNAQIAGELCLSVRTVEGHIYRTFAKLGISRREELTVDLLAAE
ncbi:LuxR C-terminal-related transcriptional regulator [Arthrobacter sp. I2-34]|uniref:LuxR C-terminal-related transcriptional regulator n=1 Tax=Arthrobacter hankyongi TaxID=2904801 RepID=A0ABS9L1K0_9MICC|nr:LuxR family transcriptional regulator [Arthrobacter hankyongi]MCG2620529.1 LuxR C-terminal-related transcriptional regulator [Arthrobacter hankyongi]